VYFIALFFFCLIVTVSFESHAGNHCANAGPILLRRSRSTSRSRSDWIKIAEQWGISSVSSFVSPLLANPMAAVLA
jgi:peptide subunit release factor RF-3